MADDALERLLRDARLTRRELLARGGSLAALALIGLTPARLAASWVRPVRMRTASYPFTLGVASGDPTPTGIVLWTRLAPDPLHGGGMEALPVQVKWELASDERFTRIVKHGVAVAEPAFAHSVHVEVEGLQPSRVYWYRFIVGGEVSPVGRTRTAPATRAALGRMAFAFVSCQNYQQGYYPAYRHLAAEDVELVVHLGDYIYESGVLTDTPRQHEGPEPLTLEAYRNRYARYKSDADLQAAHAAAPFILTWDDHEVVNDYAGVHDTHNTPEAEFLLRRAAAYHAYYEHQPLRRSQMANGPDAQMYRRFDFGSLLQLNVLDTRQYRTDQPCGGGNVKSCPEAADPAGTIMGDAQERWLLDGLSRSHSRWNVLANQVPFVPVLRPMQGGDVGHSMDKWDGYAAQQHRVAAHLASGRVENPVIITGDVHVSWVANMPRNIDDPSSPPAATEFVGTSISSGGNGAPLPAWGKRVLDSNPHVSFFNGQRGYVRCVVTKERWTSDYRVVPYVDRPDAPVSTAGSFVVESGRAGAVKA